MHVSNDVVSKTEGSTHFDSEGRVPWELCFYWNSTRMDRLVARESFYGSEDVPVPWYRSQTSICPHVGLVGVDFVRV